MSNTDGNTTEKFLETIRYSIIKEIIKGKRGEHFSQDYIKQKISLYGTVSRGLQNV
mgnify:CR=1 FL=1